MDALGISAREFSERSGISRNTVASAIAGGEKVRAQTFMAIEAVLDQYENRVHGDGPIARDLGAGMVAITARDHDRTITVEGPVGDTDALVRAVERLLARKPGPEGDLASDADVS